MFNKCHWPGPRSLATTSGVSVDILSCGYLDVSVPRVRLLSLWIQDKIPFEDHWKSEAGAKSSDFAIPVIKGGFPHSEIPGSKPVRSSPRLIAAYHVLHRLCMPRHPPNALTTLDRSHCRWPSSRRHAATCFRPAKLGAPRTGKDQFSRDLPGCARSGGTSIVTTGWRPAVASRHEAGTRTNLLLTMWTEPAQHPQGVAAQSCISGGNWPAAPRSGSSRSIKRFAHHRPARRKRRASMVEPDGIEPTTYSLQSYRSPN